MMRFEISTASYNYSDDEKGPCEEAIRIDHGKRFSTDERSTDDPAKIPACKGESAWWYAEGINHRVENGHIKRELPLSESRWHCWVVELNTIEDLMSFIDKQGCNVIVGAPPSYSSSGLPTIMIYDDYVE